MFDAPFARLTSSLTRLTRRLADDRRGNILMMMGFAIVPLSLALGFGVDYSRAARMQTQLNTIADAAALAAVDPTVMLNPAGTPYNAAATTQSVASGSVDATTTAVNMFASQVSSLPGLVSAPSITVNVVDTVDNASTTSAGLITRTATVTYTAQVQNLFGGLFGVSSLTITGTANTTSSPPANVNVYVMLDTSPSMLLPTTSAGIQTMELTSMQLGLHNNMSASDISDYAPWGGSLTTNATYGCAFACHTHNFESIIPGVNDGHDYNEIIFLNTSNSTTQPQVFAINMASSKTVDPESGNVYSIDTTPGSNFGKHTFLGCNAAFTSVGKASLQASATNSPYSHNINLLKYYTVIGAKCMPIQSGSYQVQFADSWWAARNMGLVANGQSPVTLRVDDEGTAAQGLIATAKSVENTYGSNVKYQMQFFTFNYAPPTALTNVDGSKSQLGSMTDVSNITDSFPDLGALTPYLADSNFTAGDPQTWSSSPGQSGTWYSTTSNYYSVPSASGWTVNNSSTPLYTGGGDTNINLMLQTMSQTMGNQGVSGNGTYGNPKNLLLIITDGMDDEFDNITSTNCTNRICEQWSGDPTSSPTTPGTTLGGAPDDLTLCQKIKDNGNIIAILYTVYDPSTLNPAIFKWAATVRDGPLSGSPTPVVTALQACASLTPEGGPLMQQVAVDQDMSQALNALFIETLATARITH